MTERTLAEEVAITAELTGTTMSEAAAEVMGIELSAYNRAQVLGALRKCRRELKSRLTIASVIERLDDGRPGSEEAWAMIPMHESATSVWTGEMSQAFGVALRLIESGDVVAARMAFKETYQRMVQQARDKRQAVEWMVTLGHDPGGRERPLLAAVEAGRLTLGDARNYCPALPAPSKQIENILRGVENLVRVK